MTMKVLFSITMEHVEVLMNVSPESIEGKRRRNDAIQTTRRTRNSLL